MSRRIGILGSTGSVGEQTLDVIRAFPGKFDVVALSAHTSMDRLLEQEQEFQPEMVALTAPERIPTAVPEHWLTGEGSLVEIAGSDLDILMLSVVGAAGLRPCIRALQRGTTVALANKEVLVTAGEHIKQIEGETQGELIPVDSEHSALFQCLKGETIRDVNRVIITASGGPFRNHTRQQLREVTLEEALDHPNWDMGPKVTVDSSTLMNKGLEVIEAAYLFDIEPGNVEAVIHPQSVIHGFVEYQDHSLIAQCAFPDMKLPIQYALFHPRRQRGVVDAVSFDEPFSWNFEPIDEERFPAFGLAREALRRGGSYPAVLNAANEVAVEAFLEETIEYHRIPHIVERCLTRHDDTGGDTLDHFLEADRWAREQVRRLIRKGASVLP